MSVLVKLQRPPPDMRIFFPGLLAWSSTVTLRPRLPASIAHIKPAALAPIIKTSVWAITLVMGGEELAGLAGLSCFQKVFARDARLYDALFGFQQEGE